ncbi:nucleotidyltransferase [Geobacter sp. DSM 9736]|uniref:nucleotidyltransferase n=1 Tax=Geobacter sp. DSM 9736 TaxID=1277350 RepID=UPI000B5077F9|nr:nucleotidyltransferase [Geobacter sp. DSM 9736]SNB46793.1 Uncharacterised nucleotidyltransferase [Geobacter sp. DSM 9736]
MEKEPLIDRVQGEAILNELITDEQWAVCSGVITKARRQGLGFAMGGGLAFSAYSGNLRNTKDMDFFILPRDEVMMKAIMAEEGFEEYKAVPYDPTWSYRGAREGYIIDLLWRMLNNRTAVDETWTGRGWEVKIRGVPFRLIPPEELLWSKLYIMRRDRCDWPDILGLLYAQGPTMDWDHLLDRLQHDSPVLAAVTTLFRWLCPAVGARIPASVWKRMGICAGAEAQELLVNRERTALFKGHDWFPGNGG